MRKGYGVFTLENHTVDKPYCIIHTGDKPYFWNSTLWHFMVASSPFSLCISFIELFPVNTIKVMLRHCL